MEMGCGCAHFEPAKPGKPEPKELSRHVTIHHATDAHLREDNALIALMLATSLIRGLSEMHEWFDARGS